MSGLRVLIVGASVAGPTAAYWFARAGARITIIERWPELRKGGQNIDLRSTGVTVMRKMAGMQEAVNAKRVDLEAMRLVDDYDRPIATLGASGDPEQQSLLSEYEIFRGDLNQILYDLTKDDPAIEYVFGEQVTAIRHKPNPDEPVDVEFLNGRATAEYDLVVACDGSTSRTRAIGLNCGVRDHIYPQKAWATYFSIPGDLLKGSKMAVMWTRVPGRAHFMVYDPAGKTRIGLMDVLSKSDEVTSARYEKALKASRDSSDALKTYVAERFASPLWRVPELLKGLSVADDVYSSEIIQVRVPNLCRGRFVLVGDAGYGPGPTGTGTSLAMSGAYILAGEINNHKGDLAAGLEAYELRMKPIINDMQHIPPGVPGAMAPQTAWGLWLRNLVIVVAAWGSQYGSWFSWIGGLWSTAFAKDTFELPDYQWVRTE